MSIRNAPEVRTFSVLYRGLHHDIEVLDRGFRPPHPQGQWIDQMVAEACRVRFGCDKGSCRVVQGTTDTLEFREAWEQPLVAKVWRDVDLVVEPGGRKDRVCVRSRSVPGADEAAVIFAAAFALCKRRLGPGELSWRGDSALVYKVGGRSDDPTIPCRYTVHHGNTSAEILVDLPSPRSCEWEAVVYFVSKACLARFGSGRLEYLPDLGETHFAWK